MLLLTAHPGPLAESLGGVESLVNHPETAQYVEDSTPLVTRPEPIITLGGGVTTRMAEQRQVLRDRVISLPKRWQSFTPMLSSTERFL